MQGTTKEEITKSIKKKLPNSGHCYISGPQSKNKIKWKER